MIWYITGKPRSGKSYYAVHKLVSVEKDKRYDNIYTNIGGFKFDKFDTVKKQDFEEFFDVYVPALYKEFKKAKKELEDYDQWLIDKIKEDGYYKSAFFVDEAQEYLPNDRVHIRWLFSYQGHLGFDFYFITQALGLIHAKYKYTVESVTNSVSSSNKIFANILSSPLLEKIFKDNKVFKKLQANSNYGTYQLYASTKMTRDDKVDTFRLIFKKEIFDLYKSGDKVKQKSPILGKFFMLLLLILSLYGYYKYVTGKMKKKSDPGTKTQTVLHTKTTTNTSTSQNSLTFDDATIIVPVSCRYDYCDSKFFKKLPYGLFRKYKDDIYKLVFYHELKYSTNIYIETTEHNMQMFSSFLNTQNNVKNKSMIGGILE
ncbi:MAG: hypothetical protein FAF03_08595 [Epsilonproteobacteria bacterium]|nr:hypothetical protein [Campylobacterota bacterium]